MKKIFIITTFIFSFFGGCSYYLYHQKRTAKKEEAVPSLKKNTEIEKNIITPPLKKESKEPSKKETKEEENKKPKTDKKKEERWDLSWKVTFFLFGPLLVIIYCVLVVLHKKNKIEKDFYITLEEVDNFTKKYNSKELKENTEFRENYLKIYSKYCAFFSHEISKENFYISNNLQIFFTINILLLPFLMVFKNSILNNLAFFFCLVIFNQLYKNENFKEKVDCFEQCVTEELFRKINSDSHISDLNVLNTKYNDANPDNKMFAD